MAKAVINQMGGVSAYTVQVLNEVRSAGDGVGGFVYYHETNDFFDENKGLIIESLKELADNLGAGGIIETVSGFRSAKEYGFTYDEIAETIYGGKENDSDNTLYIKNALSWYALEEVAFVYEKYGKIDFDKEVKDEEEQNTFISFEIEEEVFLINA